MRSQGNVKLDPREDVPNAAVTSLIIADVMYIPTSLLKYRTDHSQKCTVPNRRAELEGSVSTSL